MVNAIVSAYFAEKYLAGRLENLLEQEPNPEVIVVCQTGSKEFEIARAYPVEVIETPDVPTVYAAWNIGIKNATGEYLTSANCDDRLYPGALATLIDLLDKHPNYGMAYGNCDIVKQIDGDPTGRFEFGEGGLEKLLQGCFTSPMPMWRKSIHNKIGYFDETFRSAGDYEFWLRYLASGGKLIHTKRVIGAYLKRKDSIEHREQVRTIWETARARAKYRKVEP